MLLNDRVRIILFWFTIGLMIVVAILAGLTILRACGGLPVRSNPPLTITPPEVSLCPGDEQQFAVQDDVAVVWEASGGTINTEGLYTAGESPGAYTVTVTDEDTSQAAGAIVHVVACTPTPTPTPSPTAAPTAAPTATPEPSVTPSVDLDPQGDIATYASGAPVESPPEGIDIRAASIEPDLSIALQPGQDVPEELAGWSEEGEAFFWIQLHDTVPDPPAGAMNWLFVLDVDGDTQTGRPVGSRRINPDIGDEVVIQVGYDAATEEYAPSSYVWADGAWATGPEVRFTFGESRTVVGLAVSLEDLEAALAEAGGATLAPDAARARAAAEAYLADGTRVIDFYPDLPE